jgi:GAF domain-containing protein
MGPTGDYVRLLRDVADAANAAIDVAGPLRAALDAVCGLTGWPVGHVYLRSTEPPFHLLPADIWHLDDPDRFRHFRDITMLTPMPPGVGLPGHVLVIGKPAWIRDVTQSPNFPRARHALELGVRSGFGLPIKVRNAVPAVLEFFTTEEVPPDQDFLDVMEQVGTQLGRVFERFQTPESLRQIERADPEMYLALLRTVTLAANEASDLETPLKITLDAICGLTGWPVGHVYLRAAQPPYDLVSARIWHLDEPERFGTFRALTESTRLAPGEGLPGHVLSTGRAAWFKDVGERFSLQRARLARYIGVRAGFAFPIKVREEIPGVLEFFTSEAVEPNERFVDIVDQVGVQLGRVVERMRAERALRDLADGVTESRGDAFFLSLCHHLVRALDADYALIGELSGGDRREGTEPTVRTLAVCGRKGVLENFTYLLSGTPCENIVKRGPCVHPDDVQTLFPRDRILQDLGIHGYAGTPLFDSTGRALGLMAALYSRPLGEWRTVESLLQVYGARAAAELERLRAQRSLEVLEIMPHANPNPVLQFAADGTLTYHNAATERLARNMGRAHPRDILPHDTPGVVRKCLQTGVSGIVMETVEGGHTISWSFIPIQERNIVLAYAVEISFLLTLEAELRKLNMLDPPAVPRLRKRKKGVDGDEEGGGMVH